MKKTTQLKQLITSKKLEFIMEAHNGLSAGIVEEAGFSGIWASGLSISAALGVRDSNEASWTQVLDVLEFMSDRTEIPILLDGDTGYGNFNNARRLITKLEQRDIAGVCLEDKLFPKTNSFIGEAQPLADIDEFSLKIRACKETQKDPDFCVVARVEAFIAGWPLEEALRRAHAYADAGADAILMHSKKKTDEDIELFMKSWNRDTPVVIVPTKYHQVPTPKFAEMGVSLIIWANHLVRSSIKSMQQTAKQIFEDEHLRQVEPYVVPVSEIFRLQGVDELSDAEKKYLPKKEEELNAILLAASRGSDLGKLTEDKPKCMIEVRGRSLLGAMLDNIKYIGIKNISIVRGYKAETINFPGVNYFQNPKYDSTGELYSLYQAISEIQGDVILGYGDIYLHKNLFTGMMNEEKDIVVLVDALSPNKGEGKSDLIEASHEYDVTLWNEETTLKRIGVNLEGTTHGEMVGLFKLNAKGSETVKKAIEKLSQRENWEKLAMTDLLDFIVNEMNETVNVLYIQGGWLDIDNLDDLSKAYQ